MIRRIRGTLVDMAEQHVVLDVNGVGYQINTNSPTSHLLGTEASFYTHLAVRENSLDLYGFTDRDSLHIFELLIDLPKIGPKSALQILTQADAALIREAVTNDDSTYLAKVSGIGKKTTEKIVSGLKDKLEAETEVMTGTRPASASSHASDTIDALISLGYAPQDARRIVIEITSVNTEMTDSADLIRLALKSLQR